MEFIKNKIRALIFHINKLISYRIYKEFANLKYELVDELDSIKKSIPKVASKEDTIDMIIKNKASISRFGDGEFNLALGLNIPFQNANQNLINKIKNILVNNNQRNDFLVCIPNAFGSLSTYNPFARSFWQKYMITNREKICNLLNINNMYYDTNITRSYIDMIDKDETKIKNYFNKLKKIWENRNIVLVEGEMSRLGVGNDLFTNATSIKRILCPAKNAFSVYDDIIDSVKRNANTDDLILIALGPTATALAWDLYKLSYQALDVGHVDIEYEWFLMGATKKVKVKGKYVNEACGISEKPDDSKIEHQVIDRIK